MEREKLKIIYEELDGKPLSYQYLEKSEAIRIKKLLKIIPELKEWTSIQRIAKHIGGKRISTTQTIYKLAGAKKILLDDKAIAEAPIVLIRKESYTQRNNLKREKYLRPPILIKSP